MADKQTLAAADDLHTAINTLHIATEIMDAPDQVSSTCSVEIQPGWTDWLATHIRASADDIEAVANRLAGMPS